MKINPTPNRTNGFQQVCDQVIGQIARVKAAIVAESRDLLALQQRLIALALNEAEAQAWQTHFPHLVFPELALEKVRAVSQWSRRQARLHQNA